MSNDTKKVGLDFFIDKQKNEDAISLIKELGLEVYLNENGTPLNAACLYNNFEIAKYCIENGADVNTVNDDLETPLMSACASENYELTKLLLEKGAKVNMLDKRGKNAFKYAVFSQSNNLKLAELLLEYGENPFIKQPNGGSAYDFVSKLDIKEMMNLMESYRGRFENN